MISARRHNDAAAKTEGARVLVVEDEGLILMSVLDMLEEIGCSGHGASNGQAALDMIQNSHEVDAVVVDISLPDMSGQDLAKSMRRHLPSVPIVFSTGHRMEVPAEIAATGPTAMLGKPYWTDELKAALEGVLAGSPASLTST